VITQKITYHPNYLIKSYKEFYNLSDEKLLISKDAEIKRLNDLITILINKQPQHTTTIQQLK
jgi:hypothetical protein